MSVVPFTKYSQQTMLTADGACCNQVPGNEVMVPRLDFTVLLAPGAASSFTAAEAQAWMTSQIANFLMP